MPKEYCTTYYTEAQNPYCSQWLTGDRLCYSIQNYCTINGQKAVDNIPSIVSSYPTFSGNLRGTNSVANFNSIKTILNNIYNFGINSIVSQVRTPNTSSFQSATAETKPLQSQYNALLSIIGGSTVSGNPKITSAQMAAIKTLIQNFQLHVTRCHSCNTAANCVQGGSCGECYNCMYDCSGCDSQG